MTRRRPGRTRAVPLARRAAHHPGTLFIVGIAVLVAIGLNNLTDGILNTFVVALIIGIAMRTLGIFKPSVLAGIDSLGLMMLAILILVFGPLATVELSDLASLAVPLLLAFVFGLLGITVFAAVTGKLLGYSIPMSIAIGLTALFGFPGTMILSQEAARGAGESPEEIAADRRADPAQDDRRRVRHRHHHLSDRDEHHRWPHRPMTGPRPGLASADLGGTVSARAASERSSPAVVSCPAEAWAVRHQENGTGAAPRVLPAILPIHRASSSIGRAADF